MDRATDVRFGSKADIGLPPVDVRFTPDTVAKHLLRRSITRDSVS
jgi:hypothetical protein